MVAPRGARREETMQGSGKTASKGRAVSVRVPSVHRGKEKVSAAVFGLMREAARRMRIHDSHEKAKPLCKKWIGLGTEAEYRPAIAAGLMKFFDDQTPPKRCRGWLVFTEAGAKLFKKLKGSFSISEDETSGLLSYSLVVNRGRK